MYIIRAIELPRMKIGSAFDVQLRLSELQVGSPARLEITRVVPNAGREFEQLLHFHLARFRCHGEWFMDTPDAVALINETLDDWGYL